MHKCHNLKSLAINAEVMYKNEDGWCQKIKSFITFLFEFLIPSLWPANKSLIVINFLIIILFQISNRPEKIDGLMY